ncbi:MAG TPA: hypothetical protein VJ574_00455 [Candidatus Bathyarchaeia archaeon]|nr:hypothetical protein [Candidatus Bathyarchaeia archaeon]
MVRAVSEKVLHFTGKKKDLGSAVTTDSAATGGYKTQPTKAPLGIIIQAKKAGFLRDVITADRAFAILISGQPDDFTINMGIGMRIQNLAVVVFETQFISWLFLVIGFPEMIWTRQIEGTIIKEIVQIVG